VANSLNASGLASEPTWAGRHTSAFERRHGDGGGGDVPAVLGAGCRWIEAHVSRPGGFAQCSG